MNENNATGRKQILNSARFEHLLRRLHPDRSAAGARYEDLRWQLGKFFEWNCACDAEDLVDQTLDRTAQKLEEQEIHDVVAFAWGVAGNIRLEANKRAARKVAIRDAYDEEEYASDSGRTEKDLHAKIDRDRQFKCLQRCIQRLSEDDRKLFVDYYRSAEDSGQARQRLAARLGVTINALRVRINRMRDRVEDCVARCMASPAPEAVHWTRKPSL
jgi:DNA-directed RNA polymerase specialized sigma24 family protein